MGSASHRMRHKWLSRMRGRVANRKEKEDGRSTAQRHAAQLCLHQKCYEQTLLRPYFTLGWANVPLTKLIPWQSLCTFEDFWVKLAAPAHSYRATFPFFLFVFLPTLLRTLENSSIPLRDVSPPYNFPLLVSLDEDVTFQRPIHLFIRRPITVVNRQSTTRRVKASVHWKFAHGTDSSTNRFHVSFYICSCVAVDSATCETGWFNVTVRAVSVSVLRLHGLLDRA